jgi:hypothetical protein
MLQSMQTKVMGGKELVTLTNQYRSQLSKIDLNKVASVEDVVEAEVLLQKTILENENLEQLLTLQSKLDKEYVKKVGLFKKYVEGRVKTEEEVIGKLAEILKIKNTLRVVESRLFAGAERDKKITETKSSRFMSLASEYS